MEIHANRGKYSPGSRKQA